MCDKRRYHVVISEEHCGEFMEYLREKGIYFEPSQYYDDTYIGCDLTVEEAILVNAWLTERIAEGSS